MSNELPPELPAGYKERMDAAVMNLLPEAAKAFDIVDEFGCDNLVVNGNGVKVIIQKDDES